MKIREYRKTDLDSIVDILKLYWNDPDFIQEVKDLLEDTNSNGFSIKKHFLVSENKGQIDGFAGFKDLSDYLKPFSKGNNPTELYIIAVKEKRTGVGLELKAKLIEAANNLGYDEMLIFSPTTHDGSWKFHDTLDFEQVGKVTPPEDGEGLVWRRYI
ncbi:MAG TPA: hypothetical protein PKA60_00565 [Candidatus Paceibacterota bacterium]|nr:hypothetical protein [Candidatus Paceibacterota bacterium]